MSIIWSIASQDWLPFELLGTAAFRLGGDSDIAVEAVDPAEPRSLNGEDVLLCQVDSQGDQWALICRPAACRVNGIAIQTGIRCLSDKDDILIGGSGKRLLFSKEVIATITVHHGQPKQCPRCTLAIEDGSPVVVCPTCRVAYHQDAAFPRLCYSYSNSCIVCQGSTALNAGYAWPPEGW